MNACLVYEERSQVILDIEQDAESKSLMGLGKGCQHRSSRSPSMRYGLCRPDQYGLYPGLSTFFDRQKRRRNRREKKFGTKTVSLSCPVERMSGFFTRILSSIKTKYPFPRISCRKYAILKRRHIPARLVHSGGRNTACHTIIYSNPVTPCDIFLKKQYFSGLDEQGLGTILIGIKSSP